jgi:hypothetical protein
MSKVVRQMTEEKRAEILRLWNLGYSSSKIAAEIGLSRNSVIGAVHRMRQAGIEIINKERPKSKKAVIPKVKTPKLPKKDPLYDNPVDILGLRRSSCRFIVEEGSTEATKYCNQKAWKASYCQDHYKICYYKSAVPASKLRLPAQ